MSELEFDTEMEYGKRTLDDTWRDVAWPCIWMPPDFSPPRGKVRVKVWWEDRVEGLCERCRYRGCDYSQEIGAVARENGKQARVDECEAFSERA